jgi:hypothetical protein
MMLVSWLAVCRIQGALGSMWFRGPSALVQGPQAERAEVFGSLESSECP